jgi:hypothetical protein
MNWVKNNKFLLIIWFGFVLPIWGFIIVNNYNRGQEDSPYNYSIATSIVEKHPSLKSIVVDFYKDKKITNNEYHELTIMRNKLEEDEKRLDLIEDKKKLEKVLIGVREK